MRDKLEVVRTLPLNEPVVEPLTDSHERPLPRGSERELGAIVTHMWENAEMLLRQEVELGLAELERRTDKLKQSLLMATIGGATLYAGILVLLAAAVFGLAKVVEPWLAALIVGGIVTGIGATLVLRGETKGEEAVKPDEHLHRTTRAMKEAIK